MARRDLVAPDPEDLRQDLLAALAAGRELGPEMDTAIVDAHLRRHYGDKPQRPRQPQRVVQRNAVQLGAFMPPLMIMLGIMAFVALLVASHGMGWWLFWPLMAWGWCWGGRRRWGYGGYSRYDRRWNRYGRGGYDGGDVHDGQDGDSYDAGYHSGGDAHGAGMSHEVV